MVLAAIVLFLVIRRYGESLTAPAPSIATTHTSVPETAAAPNALLHVLLTLAVVAIVGRLLARVFVSIRQPPVIGEVLAGIALGPSLLGRLAPDVYSFILPSSIAPFLNVIAQLGVILYMFLVGLELNATRVRIRAHATVAISHASILAPFILGSLLPAFFAFAGMRTRIDLVSGTSAWTICALIVVVATAGKFGGTFIAARVAGLGSRQAASLGILMNTRGLMELIVLNTGLDLGVISPMLFTMMVLMALATTMATTPIVDLLVPGLVRYNRPA